MKRAWQPGATLDELQAKDFISEQRVVASVIHRRPPKLWATHILQELQAKGLYYQAVADAVTNLKATELERAREIWRKKFGAPPADAIERGRQMRFLLSRGFKAEVVGRVVKGRDD